MGQALHIFKKDVRHLRGEIGLVLVLAALLNWAERRPGAWLAETLFTLAACVLIARLIHGEAIPGTNQFWITRPYRWQSLLWSKLAFVFVFVSVPLMLVQFLLAEYGGFSPAMFLTGLFWSQALILFCGVLPITAMAAMTSGIAAFLSFAMLPLTLGLISNSEVMMLFGRWQAAQAMESSLSLEWIRSSIAVTGSALISTFVIYNQYKRRRTAVSGWVVLRVGSVFALVYLLLPATAMLKMQSWLSDRPFDASRLRLALDATKKGKFPNQGRSALKGVKVILPIAIEGIPSGLEAFADEMSTGIRGADGRVWNAAHARVVRNREISDATVFVQYLQVDPEFYRMESPQPVTVHVKLYLTLLGDARQSTIPIQAGGVNTIEGLHCGPGYYDQLYCLSVFRWPRRAVYAAFGERGSEPFTTTFSYSPFPAELGFSPLESHWVSTPLAANSATIVTRQPLSHFEREFDVTNVHLDAFLDRPATPIPFGAR